MKSFFPTILTALAAASASLAQSDFATGLVDALRQNNLTTLADIVQANADQLVPALQEGGNKTVLAPTNDAFAALGGNAPEGDELRSIITYHVLNYTLEQDDIDGDVGAHTIALTLLSGEPYVSLPNNRSQAVVLQEGEGDDEPSQIIQTTQNISFVSANDGPRYQNILVQPITQVLSIPGNISTVASALNTTLLVELLTSTSLLDALASASAVTVFAPTDAAIQQSMQQISSATPEQQMAVLANHVLNSTVVYSTQFGDDEGISAATTASGQQLTFEEREDSVFVRSGDTEARIVRSDILTDNGVIHLIDTVLFNTQTNTEAASSAVESNTAAAATQTGVPGTNDNATGGSNNEDAADTAFGSHELSIASLATVVLASSLFAIL